MPDALNEPEVINQIIAWAERRSVAREVGQRLGYTYPEDLDERVVKYVYKIKDMK
jgi:hypothetical protein